MIGNAKLQPGELSLAHNGIFVWTNWQNTDETCLSRYARHWKMVRFTLARFSWARRFPANCTLIAAVNPCPCGWRFHPEKICAAHQYTATICKQTEWTDLDRIDLHIWVEPITTSQFFMSDEPESSQTIRSRVQSCRIRQTDRYHDSSVRCNADLQGDDLWKYCHLTSDCQRWLIDIANQELLSARSVSRIIKVARTIADLAESATISKEDIAEAIGYRVNSEGM